MISENGATRTDCDRSRWTPMGGLRRACVHGIVLTLILIAVSVPLVQYAPAAAFNPIIRAFMAFALGWIIFGVVQDAAGMTGALPTALGVVLCGMVLGSHHLIAAQGLARPWLEIENLEWLDVITLLGMNFTGLIGLGAAALLCHTGAPGGSVAGDIMSLRLWWGSWGE